MPQRAYISIKEYIRNDNSRDNSSQIGQKPCHERITSIFDIDRAKIKGQYV